MCNCTSVVWSFGPSRKMCIRDRCLTGQVPTQFLGKGRGHLHEMPDQLATLRSFLKWAERIEYPDAAPAMVSRAFQEMMSGRRGPVALEMPWDVFTQRADVAASKPFDRFPAPQPDTERVKAAAALVACLLYTSSRRTSN